MELKEIIQKRRTYYGISNNPSIDTNEIKELIEVAIKNSPSAFNSQSYRLVVLFGDNHLKLWEIVKNTLQKIISADQFSKTEEKINNNFAAGFGTVLFFEDQEDIKKMQSAFPIYADNFPVFSEHSSGMLQYGVWLVLEDAGLGCSLQHYNPLIDEEVLSTWNLPSSWKLVAQMPFGNPIKEPNAKNSKKIRELVQFFK
jgi:predicted oxidoreductase (fatty acid repression mutant protein)